MNQLKLVYLQQGQQEVFFADLGFGFAFAFDLGFDLVIISF